jgi:hypothetical protein
MALRLRITKEFAYCIDHAILVPLWSVHSSREPYQPFIISSVTGRSPSEYPIFRPIGEVWSGNVVEDRADPLFS